MREIQRYKCIEIATICKPKICEPSIFIEGTDYTVWRLGGALIRAQLSLRAPLSPVSYMS